MKALRIDKTEDGTKAAIVDFDEAELMPGNVTVRVSHSTVNYKDGLAITGKNPVVRVSPMIGGIDFAGTVETSEDPSLKPGDRVVCNGWGLSETHFGGYAEKARVKGEWLVKLPDAISEADAMGGWYRGLHRDAVGAGHRGPRGDAEGWPGDRHRRGRWRRFVRYDAARQGRLACHRLDRPCLGVRLPEGARRGRDHGQGGTLREEASPSARSAGPRASTRSAR